MPSFLGSQIFEDSQEETALEQQHLLALKKIQIPRRKVHHSGSFFPAEYEYVNNFFPARPDFPKFYVKGLKITLNSCF